MGETGHDILLINPWVYDFAAYDLWAKPLGLLYLAALLERNGWTIHYIDCLDIHHPALKIAGIQKPKRRLDHRGHFYREEVAQAGGPERDPPPVLPLWPSPRGLQKDPRIPSRHRRPFWSPRG